MPWPSGLLVACPPQSCDIVLIAITYFCLSETKGESMEEMSDIFGNVGAVRMSKNGNNLVDINEELTNVSTVDNDKNIHAKNNRSVLD